MIPFRHRLKDSGYIEGRNVAIEYRFADLRYDRLSALAADLVRRQATVIVAAGLPAALAAKAATATIPIVFQVGGDPVKLGFVASLNRPGGNATGVTTLNVEVVPKQLELVHEVVPMATVVALLVNPANQFISERTTRDAEVAARTLGLLLHVLHASTERDFDTVFATLDQTRVGALPVAGYDYSVDWTPMLAGLAPAGMAASLAAPDPYVRLSRSGRSQRGLSIRE